MAVLVSTADLKLVAEAAWQHWQPGDSALLGAIERVRSLVEAERLADIIDAKRREIEATGLCQWEYADPLSLHGPFPLDPRAPQP